MIHMVHIYFKSHIYHYRVLHWFLSIYLSMLSIIDVIVHYLTMHMFEKTRGRHLNMSVYYTYKLVSNWCRAKLYDYTEKTLIEQYCFLT